MSKRQARIILLCEGRSDERFVAGLEKPRNYRRERLVPLPLGQGAGEQYVRRQYAIEVRAFRKKSNSQPNLGLLVMTDADNLTVALRENTLEAALEADMQERRGEEERIALLIPKRHVECWITYLRDGAADEETEYDHPPISAKQCVAGGEAFGAYDGPAAVPEGAPPSMRKGRAELERLPNPE